MANPPKAKGTQGENEVVNLLTWWGMNASRESTNKASDDVRIDGLPDFGIEVKFRKRWDLFKWIRAARARHKDGWAIFCIHGDRRTAEGKQVGSVMVVDADLGARMIASYYREDIR